MFLEIERFHGDVAADPQILAKCFHGPVGVEQMVQGARELGYDFTLEDLKGYYDEPARQEDAIKMKYTIVKNDPEMRQLTPEETELVSGGDGSVVVATVESVAVWQAAYAVEYVGITIQVAAVLSVVITVGIWSVAAVFTSVS